MKQKKNYIKQQYKRWTHFSPTGGDATLALYPRTKPHGVAIYLF